MKIKLTLVAFLSALSLQAAIFPERMLLEGGLRAPKSNDEMRCANFSGNWKGKCEGFSGVQEMPLTIVQLDCNSIVIGNSYTRLGGLKTEMEAAPAETSSFSYSVAAGLEWNAEKTGLQAKLTGAYRALGTGNLHAFAGEEKMYFEGPSLIAEIHIDSINARCKYERQ